MQDTSADLFVSAVEMAVDIALEMSPTTWVQRGWIVTKTIRALAKDGWVAAGIEAVKLVPKVGNKLSEGLYNANQEAQILEAFAQGDREKVQALEEGKYVEKFMDKALGLAIKKLAKNKPTPNNTDAADNTNAQPTPTDKLDADQPHTNANELAADEALVAKLAADKAALLVNIRKALNAPNPPAPNPPAPKPAKKATRNPAQNSRPTKQPILQQKPAQNPNPTPTQENAESQGLPKNEKVEDPATDIVLTRHQKQQALRNQIGSENLDAFDVYMNTFKNKPDELDAKFLEIETALAENQKILIAANGNLLTRPKMDEAVEKFAKLQLKDPAKLSATERSEMGTLQANLPVDFVQKIQTATNTGNDTSKRKAVFDVLKAEGDVKVAKEKAEAEAKVAAEKATAELYQQYLALENILKGSGQHEQFYQNLLSEHNHKIQNDPAQKSLYEQELKAEIDKINLALTNNDPLMLDKSGKLVLLTANIKADIAKITQGLNPTDHANFKKLLDTHNPNGTPNLEALQKDLDLYKSAKANETAASATPYHVGNDGKIAFQQQVNAQNNYLPLEENSNSSAVLQHSSQGDFPVDPRIQAVNPASMAKHRSISGGGHGESFFTKIREINETAQSQGLAPIFTFVITKTYPNGVRVGYIPQHTNKLKKGTLINRSTGQAKQDGQSWFPESWTDADIKEAGEYIMNNCYRWGIDWATHNDGAPPVYGWYKGVKVAVMKTNGKPATVFPDGNEQ